jgi:hypothetical protein
MLLMYRTAKFTDIPEGKSSVFVGGDIFEYPELFYVGHVSDIDRVVNRDEGTSAVGRAWSWNDKDAARDNNHIREDWDSEVIRCAECVSARVC